MTTLFLWLIGICGTLALQTYDLGRFLLPNLDTEK